MVEPCLAVLHINSLCFSSTLHTKGLIVTVSGTSDNSSEHTFLIFSVRLENIFWILIWLGSLGLSFTFSLDSSMILLELFIGFSLDLFTIVQLGPKLQSSVEVLAQRLNTKMGFKYPPTTHHHKLFKPVVVKVGG